jgi:hypothetical protein
MTDGLPLTHFYNLARLGHAGDVVTFVADDDQRTAIARWSGVLSVESLCVTVDIKKLASTRYGLSFNLTVDVTQACVVSLEPVPAHTVRGFSRELNFVGPARRKLVTDESGPDLVLDGTEEEGPEEIENLQYDLAGPVLEEYVLSLEPYPRAPGVEFRTQTDALDQPESPFAVLKGLK